MSRNNDKADYTPFGETVSPYSHSIRSQTSHSKRRQKLKPLDSRGSSRKHRTKRRKKHRRTSKTQGSSRVRDLSRIQHRSSSSSSLASSSHQFFASRRNTASKDAKRVTFGDEAKPGSSLFVQTYDNQSYQSEVSGHD